MSDTVFIVPTDAIAVYLREKFPGTEVIVDYECPPDAVYRITREQYEKLRAPPAEPGPSDPAAPTTDANDDAP